MKKNHWIWMVIGCGLPLLFIFLAPSFGIGGGSSLFIFILFMFAIHLFMPHGSHGHRGHNHTNRSNNGQDHNKKNLDGDSAEKRNEHQHH
ncbi:MAG: hypothetical protein COB32_11320 [Halomonas sp.]|jgi:hypothetical protein|uniref:DUF2933 domain-containing protein n=1 Tax=Leeuwenhoekiella nanhaiensis TaxID=1655491 RepID=A0A2G1VMG9_9FLAO|nr:hypothetical protein [Leeuwenhoekiella nanhaiensis]PHQ27953.1 hypothetical protein CJ305_17235 [Leeuwenhoekiella nanhaiensis]PHR01126.1 MAG: hypothetical protein COB32_11320 [Halomonas sp.]